MCYAGRSLLDEKGGHPMNTMCSTESGLSNSSHVQASGDTGLRREAIVAEARFIERTAFEWALTYRIESAWWRRLHTSLIVGAGILAAASAGTILGSLTTRLVSGLVALAAAGLSAIATALGAGGRASRYEVMVGADDALANAARVFVNTVAPFVSQDELLKEFSKLAAHRDRVIAEAEVIHVVWSRRIRRADRHIQKLLAAYMEASYDLGKPPPQK